MESSVACVRAMAGLWPPLAFAGKSGSVPIAQETVGELVGCLQSLAPPRQAVRRTEGTRCTRKGWVSAPPRRDPDEMVSISPS